MKFIPTSLYKKILATVPVPCVDIAVIYKGKFLILKRKNNPEKGKWWPIGGRILKGERLEQAAKRKVREEVGVAVQRVEFLGGDSTIFKNSAFQGVSAHTVNFMFKAVIKNNQIVKLDNQSSDYQWVSKIDPKWHWYVQRLCRLAGFK